MTTHNHSHHHNDPHDHSHHHTHADGSSLGFAFVLNLVFSFVEFFGGLWTNSIAVLANSLHDLGDSIALGLAWYLERYSQKAQDAKYSFGYRRYSLLSAVVTTVILTTGSCLILVEAFKRLQNPEPINPDGMIVFALLGVAVNAIAAWKVFKRESHSHRAVFWHQIEDVLGWIAVLAAAIAIRFTSIERLDPILSVGINLFVLLNVLRRVPDMLRVFLQGVPGTINIEELKKKMKSQPHVLDVHALQVWSLDGFSHVLNCHIIISDKIDKIEMINTKKLLKEHLAQDGFKFVFVEFEFESENCKTD